MSVTKKALFALENGVDKAAEFYNLPAETINRYIRFHRSPSEKEFKTYSIISDVHVPFHNKRLLEAYLKTLKGKDGLIIAGDFVDMFSISSYAENSLYDLKNGLTLKQEYNEANKILDLLNNFKGEKHFLYGNHENRYYTWLKKKDHAKFDGAINPPHKALHLKGWNVIKDYPDGFVKLGEHLEVMHGIKTTKYVAANTIQDVQGSVLFGHTHRVQSYVEGTRAAYNIGGLFDINSDGFKYMPRTQRAKWCNGFAEVAIDSKGFYYVNLIQAYNGKFYK